MRLQLLVSALNAEPAALAEKMNIGSEAVIVNQADGFAYEELERKGRRVRCYTFAERGVGLSRNNALLRADGDICLFADEDIRYEDDYEEKVLREFEKNPDADMIVFNIDVAPSRRTYHIEKYGRVRFYNCGRYPTYSFAARTERLHGANITFSLLFGGGAKYSNGEDSLFIRECLKKGFHIYKAPVTLGREEERQSTWFHGYNWKFFYDRGFLYHYLYKRAALAMAFQFLLRHRDVMCGEIPAKKAFKIMREGISEARRTAGR